MDSNFKEVIVDPGEIRAEKISLGKQDQQDYQDRTAFGRREKIRVAS